jgi:hypothetical protein
MTEENSKSKAGSGAAPGKEDSGKIRGEISEDFINSDVVGSSAATLKVGQEFTFEGKITGVVPPHTACHQPAKSKCCIKPCLIAGLLLCLSLIGVLGFYEGEYRDAQELSEEIQSISLKEATRAGTEIVGKVPFGKLDVIAKQYEISYASAVAGVYPSNSASTESRLPIATQGAAPAKPSDKDKALSKFRNDLAAVLAKARMDQLSLSYDSKDKYAKDLFEYRKAINNSLGLKDEKEGFFTSFEDSLFSDKGGLHTAYRTLMLFLNLIFALILLLILQCWLRASSDEYNDIVKKLVDALGEKSQESAGKLLSTVVLGGGLLAIPAALTYQVVSSSPAIVSAQRAPVTIVNQTNYAESLARLERSIGEMKTLKAEVAAGIAEQKDNNKLTTDTIYSLANGYFDKAGKVSDSQMAAYSKLGESLGKVSEPLEQITKSLSWEAVNTAHLASAAQDTNWSLNNTEKLIFDESKRQSDVLNQLLVPLALQGARTKEFLQHSVTTEPAWCNDFHLLDNQGQSRQAWTSFMALHFLTDSSSATLKNIFVNGDVADPLASGKLNNVCDIARISCSDRRVTENTGCKISNKSNDKG